MQETSLHAALKNWYTLEGDQQEVPVDGYLVDVVRGELLIEIQTRNFSALKDKLGVLLATHPVRLVHPIAREKWIVRLPAKGAAQRRKSPRRGRLEHLFGELVRIPHLVGHPNFTLEVVFIQEEEVRREDGRGSWRRKGWSIADRRLLAVLDQVVLRTPQDFAALLPPGLAQPFTVRELAAHQGLPAHLAQKMAYCLRQIGVIQQTGKRGNAYLYTTAAAADYSQKV